MAGPPSGSDIILSAVSQVSFWALTVSVYAYTHIHVCVCMRVCVCDAVCEVDCLQADSVWGAGRRRQIRSICLAAMEPHLHMFVCSFCGSIPMGALINSACQSDKDMRGGEGSEEKHTQ